MRKNTSKIFTALGLTLGLLAVWISFANLNAPPLLLKAPEAAAARVETMMDALCSADYSGVSAVLFGNPELGVDGIPETPTGQALWPLYQKSLSYTLCHAPYATDSGLAVCVDVRYLDIPAMTALLASQMTALPPEGTELMENWVVALEAVPKEAYPYGSHTVTLNLVCDQGQWWVLPEEALMNLICGITK